jgi:hypothetical protein
MIRKFMQAVIVWALATPGLTQEVDLAALGEIELVYEQPDLLQFYPAQQVSAEVGFRHGEAFAVLAPRRIQQVQYLVLPGGPVQAGQAFAVLRGPEIHHFLSEFEVSRKLLEAAEKRFNSNKILYERKSINEGLWLEITEQYYAARLEYQHMRHFNDLVVATDEKADTITLAAPVSGLVDYAPDYSGIRTGESIALFLPEDIVRLRVELPVQLRSDVAFLQMPACKLDLDSVSARVNGFFVAAWTEPLRPGCNLMLGQHLLVTPYIRAEVYQLASSAVFQWQNSTYILMRNGSALVAAEVEVLGAVGADSLVRSGTALQDRDILVSSVSAVQGILLGLGGE